VRFEDDLKVSTVQHSPLSTVHGAVAYHVHLQHQHPRGNFNRTLVQPTVHLDHWNRPRHPMANGNVAIIRPMITGAFSVQGLFPDWQVVNPDCRV